uniref:Uncharacterized protein n=1 Tax=Monopterus albus TaxID=43700 RepID=A0A3Q3JTD9_MONAL
IKIKELLSIHYILRCTWTNYQQQQIYMEYNKKGGCTGFVRNSRGSLFTFCGGSRSRGRGEVMDSVQHPHSLEDEAVCKSDTFSLKAGV